MPGEVKPGSDAGGGWSLGRLRTLFWRSVIHHTLGLVPGFLARILSCIPGLLARLLGGIPDLTTLLLCHIPGLTALLFG